MKLKIYIFRHGQSYYNREHKFTGWKDSKLTPQGVKDARTVAKKLKNKKIDLAYCSHLTRSKHTLREVLKFHPECKKKIVDDRVIERCYGKLQGMSHKSFIEKDGTEDYKLLLHHHRLEGYLKGKERKEFIENIGAAELKIMRRSYDVPPPGGESVKDVEKRVIPFIKDLIKKMKKEKINVAISAHGNSMRPFRRYFEKLTIPQMMRLENPWDNYFEYTIDVK
ncbi:histidine phosphatase family protein [Nanoarchaeota archaeon]